MAKEKQEKAQYTAESIQVLEGLEPVRKRPGMYIGSTGVAGLHHLVWEILDNSIDEAMAGYCTEITVELLPDNKVAVTDNGRGIPVDVHKQTGKSALETILTVLHAGGKFGGGGYKVSGGLHGVGASVVNALSTSLRAEVRRDGKLHVQEFKIGVPTGPIKIEGKAEGTGTKIIFAPDASIFETTLFNLKTIVDRVRQTAYLTKGLKLNVIDRRTEKTAAAIGAKKDAFAFAQEQHSFYFEGGVSSYVLHLNKKKEQLHYPPVYINKTVDDISIEVALQYTNAFTENVYSFANNIYTPEGGMHLTGFRSALTRALNDYARKNNLLKDKDDNLSGEDVREGLTAIISVKISEPQFEGQTKQKLGNPEARPAVESVTAEGLITYLEENPSEARKMIEKNILAARARLAAKAARDTVIRKGAFEGMTLPGKLADCSSKKREECEIYLVEGDSAGGTAKQGRNKEFQAILPLRGKILNVERARLDRMLAFDEIKKMIGALGVGISDMFDLTRLRYDRIIIMTDADVDGAHIRTLLLTFFYRHMRPLVDEGHVYVAQPPLYRISYGKEKAYVYNDEAKEKLLKEWEVKFARPGKEKEIEVNEVEGEESPDLSEVQAAKKPKIVIQRFKGLGEMNAEQLWETTMNPENRTLLKVTIEDAAKADEVFSMLMGDEPQLRKRYIQAHGKEVINLDV